MSKKEIERTVTETVLICDSCHEEITMVDQALDMYRYIDGKKVILDLHRKCENKIIQNHFENMK